MPTAHTASPNNAWRKHTPGHEGWARTAHADDPNKYYMASVDTHAIEPNDYLATRIDKKYLDRIPRIEMDEDGAQWTISDGMKPVLVKPGRNDWHPDRSVLMKLLAGLATGRGDISRARYFLVLHIGALLVR